ncbi:hypothetical protein H7I41_00520 [Mycobacterium manitobense]|uniref:Uncharacterized protein n=1 Tax=[Mycobacterium] manitobense TaxID=190147 RepID=A0A9X2YJJ5_9MYCO|nr:hypothetical protein [[Mycobacterium] manitobense]MCV7168396.1 hypothetical protein [[Mycobacterium] manitobense]
MYSARAGTPSGVAAASTVNTRRYRCETNSATRCAQLIGGGFAAASTVGPATAPGATSESTPACGTRASATRVIGAPPFVVDDTVAVGAGVGESLLGASASGVAARGVELLDCPDAAADVDAAVAAADVVPAAGVVGADAGAVGDAGMVVVAAWGVEVEPTADGTAEEADVEAGGVDGSAAKAFADDDAAGVVVDP